MDRARRKLVREVKETYFGKKLKSVIVEEVDQNKKLFTSLKEVEDFISGVELPYTKNTAQSIDTSTDVFSILLSILPKDAKSNDDLVTLYYKVLESGKKYSFSLISSNSGCNVGDFKGVHQTNPKSPYKSTYEIVDMCDTDRFFISYKNAALDLVGKRFAEVKHTFNQVQSNRSLDIATMGVRYEPRIRGFQLMYNPKFVMVATLEDWAINHQKYGSLEECYIYVLGFMLAHEMSHIIRHNTDSSIGKASVESINHNVDNIISDSFINVHLENIFSGLVGRTSQSRTMLSVGIGKDYSFRSDTKGNFNKFESLNELGLGIAKCFFKVFKFDKNVFRVNDDLGYPVKGVDNSKGTSNFEGATFFVKFTCGVDPTFRNNSTDFMTLVNSILKVFTSGGVHWAAEPETQEEMDARKTEVVQGTEGFLKGRIFRDLNCCDKDKIKYKQPKCPICGQPPTTPARRGIIVSDKGGQLEVVYPESQEDFDTVLKELNSDGFGGTYSGSSNSYQGIT